MFNLTRNGQTTQVTRDEAIALANRRHPLTIAESIIDNISGGGSYVMVDGAELSPIL